MAGGWRKGGMVTGTGIGLLIGLVAATLSMLQVFGNWERQAYDLRTSLALQPDHPLLERVAIIGVDERSLNALGRWPWPRAVHADLIERLDAAGAHTIVMDFVFDHPDTPNGDGALATAASRSGNVLFTAYGVLPKGRTRDQYRPVPVVELQSPLPDLAAAGDVGMINVLPDFDGVMRRMPLALSVAGEPQLSLSAAIAARHGADLSPVPTGRLRSFLISYLGPAGTVPVYSYADVVEGRIDPATWQGRTVIIGPVAATFMDFYHTPLGRTPMTGAEIHAQAALTLMAGTARQEMSWVWNLALAPLLGLGMAAAAGRLSPAAGLLVALGLGLLIFTAGVTELIAGRVWEVVPTLVTVAVTYVVILGSHYLQERQRRSRVQDLFSRYVDRKVVEQLMAVDQTELRLGGDRRPVTLLFADVRGFTRFAEHLPPEEVVARLNAAFDQITRIIFHRGGTVDKFVGDAVMAVWNAPLPVEDHVMQAVRSACEIQTAVKVKSLGFGIGINTGEAVVGNIGSQARLEYTAIGDVVNTAAFLESQAPPGEVYITESVYRAVEGRVQADFIGAMQVKGRSEEVLVYAVRDR